MLGLKEVQDELALWTDGAPPELRRASLAHLREVVQLMGVSAGAMQCILVGQQPHASAG
jgi:hypothetical protein